MTVNPDSFLPEPIGDNWDAYEAMVERINAIVKEIERDFAVALGNSDGEWILETILDATPETENSEIVADYVREFEIEHLTYNPSDLSDYANDHDFRN